MGDCLGEDSGSTKDMGEGAAIEVEGLGRPAGRVTALLSQPVSAGEAERSRGDAGNRDTEGEAGTAGDSSSKGVEGAMGFVENRNSRGAEAETMGVVSDAGGAPTQNSWIQRTFDQVLKASQLRVSLTDAQPVTVLRVERYMEDSAVLKSPANSSSHAPSAPFPLYCYDVTITDGIYQEKCLLAHELNPLVHKNALYCGLRVKITQCSYMYHEKKLRYGFLCIEQLEIVGTSDVGDDPQEQKEYSQKPTTPLKGDKKHYLPLWNTEDPYGDVWVEKKLSQDVCVDESKLTSLFNVEMTWRAKINFQPLLVRIMHKARLRYYGKPDKKVDMPYQAYFEVADHSGMTSMVLWNSLCPEWYNRMKVGTVLLLEQYTIKPSFLCKTQPTPRDLHLKRFSLIEITLNARDPPAKINIIPENKVKAEWKLPEVKYQFITRSEVESLSNGDSCDVFGLVRYVGRIERTRKKVTYLACTQMRVIQDSESDPRTIYLTTSNESQIFITGWHKGQPYTKDSKVKSFIQWIKTQSEALHMEKTSIGGYYPFPPVPDTFLKYCKSVKVESVLTTISEMKKEIESLHYREHKRIAIQGIISAIRYVSCSITSQDASGVEPMQISRKPPFESSASESDPDNKGRSKCQRTGDSSSMISPPSGQQEQHTVTRKLQAKRKIETVEIRNPSVPSEHSYFTRSAGKKIMLQKHLPENSPARKESQEMTEATEPCRTGNKEMADVPERVQAERMCHNSWESALWTAVKDNLTQHLRYSSIFPKSFPCKFDYMHKEFLMQQCNLQAAKCKPKECTASEKTSNFENASPVEYYEVSILGINHDIAIDVAFLPICCAGDSHLFPQKGTLNNAESPCTSGTSFQQETMNKDGLSEIFSLSDEVLKAADDLEKQHVICILDVCCLGEDNVEVFLNKVYKTTEADVTDQT
ncbi:RPA-related protein RADX isoform X2 [Tiliqua scincoides]|uniref:RPA-related protein RADX isoform X2 n=1 Tax=Tiliqua scincoides TaxID=71010 RepID=UPI00346374B6